MSFQLIDVDPSDRRAWLAARRTGIGSSDAAAILGVSNFASALGVYTSKLGLDIEESDEQGGEETEPQRWGKIMEPHIAEEFSRKTNRVVSRENLFVRSGRIPFMTSTLDAFQYSDDRPNRRGVLEIKTAGWGASNWEEGVPIGVRVQIQHQLATTGFQWGSAAVLMRGQKLLYCDVERDDKFIDEVLIPAEADFWMRVQERRPVDPDGSASAREAIKLLYPTHDTKSVVLSGDLIDLDMEREELRAKIKEMEHRVEFIDQRIKMEIADHEQGVLANGVVYTHKKQDRKEHIVKASTFRKLHRIDPSI